MSNFGKKYDPNKRELNKILRENKYDPKDPYKFLRQSNKTRKKQQKTRNTNYRTRKPKIKLNFFSVIVWVILIFMFYVLKK